MSESREIRESGGERDFSESCSAVPPCAALSQGERVLKRAKKSKAFRPARVIERMFRGAALIAILAAACVTGLEGLSQDALDRLTEYSYMLWPAEGIHGQWTAESDWTAGDDDDYADEEALAADEDEDRQLPVPPDRLFVPRWRLAGGPQVRAAFRDVIKDAKAATVCVHCDGKHAAYGGVIGADGWIVTKGTQLDGHITVVLDDKRELDAVVAAEDGTLDLALLKVDAGRLPTLDLKSTPTSAVGSFLATVGTERDPVAVGVVSVGSRTIAAQPAMLGVLLDERNLPIVRTVLPRSAAARAGLEVSDRIETLNGQVVRSRDELVRMIQAHNPGDEVELVITRAGERKTVNAELSGSVFTRGRNDFQNHMGGRLSLRRFGFSSAIQHDTVLRPVDCGGPVVDLDGRVVGFNIARAGRTESYALPAAAVRDAVSRMMESSLAASVEN